VRCSGGKTPFSQLLPDDICHPINLSADTVPARLRHRQCQQAFASVIPMCSDTVVKVENLSHHYGAGAASAALDAVDVQLQAGQVTALLGPNGAGKTTLIKLLLGLLPLQHGQISVLGCAPGSVQARQRIGVMLQASGVQDNLTVLELLRLFASLYRQPLASGALLQRLDLAAIANKRFHTLSGGQQQRVLFAIALCGDPQLLILDEPSTGMDPAARRRFWEVIRECRADGRAILLCTHYMDEAEQLADNILVLNQGRVLLHASPAAIRQRVPSQLIKLTTRLDAEQMKRFAGVQSVQAVNGRMHVYCHGAENVLRELLGADPGASELEVGGADLETAFLALTQPDTHTMEQAA